MMADRGHLLTGAEWENDGKTPFRAFFLLSRHAEPVLSHAKMGV
jgi:hypothetical protein